MKSFPKILIITFLAILFFQISSTEATESYQYYQKSLGTDCAGLGGQTSVPITDCRSRNVTPPSNCLPESTIEERCFCCYFFNPTPTPTPAPASGGIKFAPQVGIPGSEFEKGFDFSEDDSTAPIAKYIRAIYNYAIGIVGILAAVVLMVGGVLWIVAGGNTTQIGEAKAWIGAALTGLVLALTSYLILSTVNPALVNLQVSQIPGVTAPPTANSTPSNPTSGATGTGSCTTEICENNYTKKACDDTGGAFSAGATCPTVGCCLFKPSGSGLGTAWICNDMTQDSCYTQHPNSRTFDSNKKCNSGVVPNFCE